MAFMDAPAGVHVMQTLVDDRSIGVQKGVWVSRDVVHWCLLDVTKSFEGVLQLPRCGIHVRRHRCLPAAAFEHCGAGSSRKKPSIGQKDNLEKPSMVKKTILESPPWSKRPSLKALHGQKDHP
jgi:hypothetical protein